MELSEIKHFTFKHVYCSVGWAVQYKDCTSPEEYDLQTSDLDLTLNNLMACFQ